MMLAPSTFLSRLIRAQSAAHAPVLDFTPNQLGVEYNAHLLESIARYVAPAFGWVPANAAALA